AIEPKDKVNVLCLPSNLECNMAINTGAPLGIEPSLRGPANPRGRGHSCGSRTQDRELSEALAAPGSEKKVHGPVLKRRQIRLPRTTRAVTRKPAKQGKKPSAKGRGQTGKETTTVCQPEVLPFASPQEERAQAPPFFCWPPAISPSPYVTMTLGQQLIVSPSVELREAFTLPSPRSDMTPMACPTMEHQHHPPEPQGSVASDQASASNIQECQETLEAAEALMTLKNSSWNWRQSHS
ncbi:doublesex-and mab-3-related transcription factor C1 isoform X1, partial [Sigmodon hispidus]